MGAELQERQDALFWDETLGAYFSSAAGDPLVPIRIKEDYDGAEPSANSISALNLLRLAHMLQEEKFETRAKQILAASRQALDRVPTAVPKCLSRLIWLFLRQPKRSLLVLAKRMTCGSGMPSCTEISCHDALCFSPMAIASLRRKSRPSAR